jgi:hemerythrin
MPNTLIWQEKWEMGIEPMDADHREMVRLLNLLFESATDEPTEVVAGLDRVLAHLRQHFDREESFLRAIDYPLLEQHRNEHVKEMAELVDLRRELAGRDTGWLDEGSVAGIKRWFFNHVIAEDHRYAEYYFEREESREGD